MRKELLKKISKIRLWPVSLPDEGQKQNPVAERKKIIDSTEKGDRKRGMNFLKRLKLIKGTLSKLRERTSFQKLKFIKNHQLKIIGDRAFDSEGREEPDLLAASHTNRNKGIYSIINYIGDPKKLLKRLGRFLLLKMEVALQKLIPTIKPNSKRKILWDVFIMLFILLKFFLIPIELCFGIKLHVNVDPAFGLVNFITSCFFIIDILLKMNTGFYENGNVVLIKFKILKHYFKSYFILDMLASVHSGKYIYEYIYTSASHSAPSSAPWLHIFFFFKLIELVHVVSNLEESIYMSETVEAISELLKLVVKIVFYSHLEACLWHAVAYFNKYSDETWIGKAGLTDAHWFDRYSTSLFWSVSALITASYGERVTPQNRLEIMSGVFFLFLGAMVFGYTIKSVGEVLDKLNKSQRSFKESVRTLNRFMKQKKINYELQDRARKYLHYFLRDRDSENDKRVEEILNKFSFNLKEELYLNTNGVILQKFPILSENFSSEFLKKLVFLMNQVSFIPEEVIFQENDQVDKNLYLITEGVVQICRDSAKNSSILRKMSAGNFFGEKEFFTGSPRNYCAKSISFSSGYSIKKEDFIETITKFPEDYERFCMIKDEILNYNATTSLKQSCFSCNVMGHDFTQCRKIRFIPDRDFVISRSEFSKPQERNGQFKRKSVGKFNSRKGIRQVKNQAEEFFNKISYLLTDSWMSSIESEEEEFEPSDIQRNVEPEIPSVKSCSFIDFKSEGKDQGIKQEDCGEFENISDFSIPNESAVNLDVIQRKNKSPKIFDELLSQTNVPPNSRRVCFENKDREEKKGKLKSENHVKESRRVSIGFLSQSTKIHNSDNKNLNLNYREKAQSNVTNSPITSLSHLNLDSNDQAFADSHSNKFTESSNKPRERHKHICSRKRTISTRNLDKTKTNLEQWEDTWTSNDAKFITKTKSHQPKTLKTSSF